jgi:flagellar assembly factor FliW
MGTAALPAPPLPTPGERLDTAIAFPDGIPGFESCRRFVLLASETLAPLQRIDSIDGPPASFLCIDPSCVEPGYLCQPTPTDLQRLEAGPDTRLLWLALVTVEPDGTVSANLRAPIAINPERMTGRQVLPNDVTYPIRHILLRVE